MKNSASIVYQINERDEIRFVNEAWSQFARENNALRLLPELVLNRSLWEFISNLETVALYREMLVRVRAGKSVHFPFRCDSPTHRRFLEMTIRRLEDGAVEFATETIRIEDRHLPDLPIQAGAAGELLRICGWCKKMDAGPAGWQEMEDALSLSRLFNQHALPLITHAICDPCFKAMKELIDED